MLKFKYREIWGQGSLFTLLTHNANTDVSLLDHPDIIATIANAQHDLPGILFNSFSDHCFLGRRNTTADNSRGFSGYWVEERRELM